MFLTDAERQKYSAEIVTLIGSPFLEIVSYAKAKDIDLIVMGTHGRGPIAHMLMGSVAEKVVRKAPCPVLTVRHPEHEFIEQAVRPQDTAYRTSDSPDLRPPT